MKFMQKSASILLTILAVKSAQALPQYNLGDKVLGGTVVYINKSGTHGYIAANQDQGRGVRAFKAHEYCMDFAYFNDEEQDYTDWMLPPLFVLKSMYEQRAEIGGFDSKKYYMAGGFKIDEFPGVSFAFATNEEWHVKIFTFVNVRCVRWF